MSAQYLVDRLALVRTLLLASLLFAGVMALGCSDDRDGGAEWQNPAPGPGAEGGAPLPGGESGNGPPPGDETAGEESAEEGPGEEPGEGPGEEGAPGPGCAGHEECPSELPHCSPQGVCVRCLNTGHCESGQSCYENICVDGICTPGSRVCEGTVLKVCNEEGTELDFIQCAPAQCQGGECTTCPSGSFQCQDAMLMRCDDASGTFVEHQNCGEPKLCSNSQAKCTTCFPAERRCEGGAVYQCSADGSAFNLLQNCGSGESCVAGVCISACASDFKANTNVGCDYWAVDLDNFHNPDSPLSAADAQYAVVVSNASDKPAEITVTEFGVATPQAQATVQPGALHIFNLPPRNVDGPTKAKLAWRIESTEPIVAYQFNPLENVGVFSNDASVLFPSNTWGTDYIAMTWQQYGASSVTPPTANGYVTVVAAFPDTEVTVVPSGQTRGAGEVPALAKGQSWTTTLQPYEVLNIESGAQGVDLTGTRITSTQPVGVFGGHECARTSENTCCCDHLEQQLLPTTAWGKTYVAARSGVRYHESDHWRILAKDDGTVITTNPSQGNLILLNSGDHFDLKSKSNFVIEANKPIMVGQFLASSFEMNGSCATGCAPQTTCSFVQQLCWPTSGFCSGTGQSTCLPGHTCEGGNCEPIGDPSFILMPPVEQFLDSYVFLVPNNYVQNYLGVVAEVGTTVILDDIQTIPLQPVGPGAVWATATVPIGIGPHTIKSTGDKPFGIVVHGYDDDVSYGYTGGLAIQDLTKP